MGEENFDDALTPRSTLTDVSAARVRPLGHAVDARLAIPRSFEDLKPRMFAISNPAVEHLNLINCLDILSQAMWTLSSAARDLVMDAEFVTISRAVLSANSIQARCGAWVMVSLGARLAHAG